MKTIKLKSIFALILFSILTFGLASIATSAGTNISNNGFEDSFPKTAGGYVVWQGKAGNDWEIFLYNANNGFGPVQITDNDYGDVNPETDGRYVTWASGAAPYGEIFLYDIATSTTIRITDNAQYDHDPKIVDGVVVWVSHSEGVDTMFGPGDIVLYEINEADFLYNDVEKIYYIVKEDIKNISAFYLVDPNNEHDDYAFRFDGESIQWVQKPSTDMLNWVTVGVDNLENMIWEQVLNKNMRNYIYDLPPTEKYYRYYIPDDGDLDFDAEYYVEDLTAGGAPYLKTKSMAVLVDPQSDGDFSVNAMWINGDREILLMDRQNKRGGFLTYNDIKDIQPAIKDNIVVWTGGEDNNSEIYLYKINSDPLAEGGGGGGSSGPCFIATAVYGSYWEPHVMTLRQFRDSHLLTNKFGNKLIKAYYKHSPPIANYIAKHDGLKTLARVGIAPLVGFSWIAINYGTMVALVVLFSMITLIIGGACFIIKTKEVS
jgi:hypothetical protein